MKLPSKPHLLRQALRRGCVVMPGAFNAAVARQAERAGFEAVYVSGAGLANGAAGLPDIGLLSLEEVVRLSGYIARAVRIPVLADADTGFGGAADVARAVRRFEQAAMAGLHLEDQVFPKRCGHLEGKQLVPVRKMVAKVRAAVRARRDPEFLILARTDARAVEGFDAAVRRAQAYLAAGADGIFPEALESAAEFREFARRLRGALLLANMTEFGKSPLMSARRLAAMGYGIVIFPLTAFRAAMAVTGACLRDLERGGSQRGWLPRLQTRQELYRLLDYDPSSEVWPASKAPTEKLKNLRK
jgi:methylisocitrate lyase